MPSFPGVRGGSALRGLMIVGTLLCATVGRADVTQKTCVAEPGTTEVGYGELVTCEIKPVGDSDMFRFSGQAGDSIAIHVLRYGGNADQCFRVIDPDGVIGNYTCVGSYVGARGATLEVETKLLKSGLYTIQVADGSNDETMSYGLIVRRYWPLPTTRTLAYGVFAEGAIDPRGDIDFFDFQGAAGDTVTINIARGSGNADQCYLLIEPDGLVSSASKVCVGSYVGARATSLTKDIKLTKTGKHVLGIYDGSFDDTFPYRVELQCFGACPASPTIPAVCPSTATYQLSPSSTLFPASGGTGTLEVNTPAGCAWTASTSGGFLTITSGSPGVGPGVIRYAVANNTGRSSRSGTITVGGQTATVNQSGAPESSRSVYLLVRDTPDAAGNWFRQMLSANGIAFTEVTASRVASTDWRNAVVLAGFSGEPTEFRTAAPAIRTAVQSGAWMAVDVFGAYILQYSGLGTVTAYPWYPVGRDKWMFVKAIDQSNIFRGIPTWDPPIAPDRLEQYLYSLSQVASLTEYLYTAPSSQSQIVDYWELTSSPGWTGSDTSSEYCKSWGGCTNNRSVYRAGGVGIAAILISEGNGRILHFPTLTQLRPGLFDYGPLLGAVFRNFISWAQETPANTGPDVCSFVLTAGTPNPASFTSVGGAGTVTVTTGTACSWTATSSDPSWLTTSSTGRGNGAVNYTVAPNTGSNSRTAQILVSGQAIAVTQGGSSPPPAVVPLVTAVSAAGYQSGGAPDSLLSVFGIGLAKSLQMGTPSATGDWPQAIGGTSLEINGRAAPLVFVSPTQINCLAPGNTELGKATLNVKFEGVVIAIGTVSISNTLPGLFSSDGTGSGPAAALNAVTYAPAPFTATTPENSGDDKRTRIALFGTGIRYAGNSAHTPNTNVARNVAITATDASGQAVSMAVEYAGPAPGYSGLDQVNVVIPASANRDTSITVKLTAVTASNAVTLTLRQSGIVVIPADSDGFGIAGSQGQFTVGEDRVVYVVRNSGTHAVTMQVRTPTWLSATPAIAEIAGGSSITVTVATNSQINTLAAGPYFGTIEFTDGAVTITRSVVLTVR